ncbi:MAG: hypothetical protein LQ338_002091 [Usnochroma carphineum]|nr:MAG: hypothetical protein LQ338_002091 [Usnochroma carphineum]
MPRPRPEEFAEDVPRRRGGRDDHKDAFDDSEDEPEFEMSEKHPRRPPPKRKPHYVDDEEDEEDEDEEEDDDRHNKQMVLRKPKHSSKSKGKEVARRKKHDTTDDEDSSDEEDKKREKKAKKKAKARKKEVITKSAWEPVPREELDGDFVQLVKQELGHDPRKILEGLEDDLLLRHTETGEYNIDAFFDEGVFSRKDEKKWKQCVKKLKTNKRRSEVLFCAAKVESPGPSYAPSYFGQARTRPTTTVLVPPPGLTRGHLSFNPHCRDCLEWQRPCHEVFDRQAGYF